MKTRRIRRERRSTTRWFWGGGLALAALTATAGSATAAYDWPTHSSPIALSRDQRLLWVVNPGDDSVSVLRTDTNTVLATIPVGDEPQSVALHPDNWFAVVANAAGGSVSVVGIANPDYAGFNASLVGNVTTGAEPWNVVISPDGQRVFVANSGQDTITVLEVARWTTIGHVDLRDSLCNDPDRERHFQPRGLAVTQDSRQLFVTRFLSLTKPGGKQADDEGKEGLVCRLA